MDFLKRIDITSTLNEQLAHLHSQSNTGKYRYSSLWLNVRCRKRTRKIKESLWLNWIVAELAEHFARNPRVSIGRDIDGLVCGTAV